MIFLIGFARVSTRADEGGTAVPYLDFLVDGIIGFMTRALKLAAGNRNI